MSFIESGHSEIVMNKIKKSLVRNHIAFVYEDVCRERMWEMNAEDAWPFNFTKLGAIGMPGQKLISQHLIRKERT